jgi:hypothetical protein
MYQQCCCLVPEGPVYIVHTDVRSMGETFRMYLLQLDSMRTRVDVVDSDAEGQSEFADKYTESELAAEEGCQAAEDVAL